MLVLLFFFVVDYISDLVFFMRSVSFSRCITMVVMTMAVILLRIYIIHGADWIVQLVRFSPGNVRAAEMLLHGILLLLRHWQSHRVSPLDEYEHDDILYGALIKFR